MRAATHSELNDFYYIYYESAWCKTRAMYIFNYSFCTSFVYVCLFLLLLFFFFFLFIFNLFLYESLCERPYPSLKKNSNQMLTTEWCSCELIVLLLVFFPPNITTIKKKISSSTSIKLLIGWLELVSELQQQ